MSQIKNVQKYNTFFPLHRASNDDYTEASEKDVHSDTE